MEEQRVHTEELQQSKVLRFHAEKYLSYGTPQRALFQMSMGNMPVERRPTVRASEVKTAWNKASANPLHFDDQFVTAMRRLWDPKLLQEILDQVMLEAAIPTPEEFASCGPRTVVSLTCVRPLGPHCRS